MCVLTSVLYVILQKIHQNFFDDGFILKCANGSGTFCRALLDVVGKSTVAENLGKNGKSNRRKEFIGASAGEIRNNSDGSACFLPGVVS